jgi:hypothetical protein
LRWVNGERDIYATCYDVEHPTSRRAMVSDLMSELAAACHSPAPTSDGEKITAGESIWLSGRPVPTERGFIGLSMGDGHAVVVSQMAVREVEKEDGVYFVRVQAGTSALIRSEVVTTLRGTSSECGCSGQSADSVARTAGGGTTRGGGDPIIIQCPLVCRVDQSCSFVLTKTGRLLRICVPMLICRRECPSQPA